MLDTHVVLWQLEGSRTISPGAQEAIEQATDLLFSVVSFAEIGMKAAIGKLSIRVTCVSTCCTAAFKSWGSMPIMASR
ncbi:MAG: hypothetical protein WKF73_22210 [Nocardioidaceae bacterium]